MKITIEIDTEKAVGELRIDDSDLAQVLIADDMYEMMLHALPLAVAQAVKNNRGNE